VSEWLSPIGLVFAKILKDLASDSAKEWAKDFCKDSLKSVLEDRDEWSSAAEKAVEFFLEEFERELIGADMAPHLGIDYEESVRRFTENKTIRLALGEAIVSSETPSVSSFIQTWATVNGKELPSEFDWQKLCRHFQYKTRTILRDSPKLREILSAEAAQFTLEGVRRLAGISPDFDLTVYREALRKRYQTLRVELINASASVPIHLLRIFVEQNVRDCQQFNPRVYDLPLDHRKRLREKKSLESDLKANEVEQLRQAYFEQNTRPVLDVLSDPTERLFVILGDPGAGKSMLLQYLALEWAHRPTVELAANPIPLLIELKTFAENVRNGRCRDFLEYLDHGIGSCGRLDQRALQTALNQGNAFLELDGLDEIFDTPLRQITVNEIINFTVRYPLARVILTSRVVGYEQEALRNAGFHHYILQDLERSQIRIFSERWHSLVFADKSEGAKYHARLRCAIDEATPVRELAQNPLLLTLMALLNRHQELPRDRSDLYEQASRLLLQQWDASRALQDPALFGKSFDYRDKQSMLRAVAFRMQTSAKGVAGNIISAEDLNSTIADWLKSQGYVDPQSIAERIIHQLSERNFILCFLGDEYYAFVHRTFLEFFCAWAFSWKFEKEKSYSIEDIQTEAFDAHWQDESWHEILRLIVGRLESTFAGQLIQGLLKKDDFTNKNTPLFLAAKCLNEVRNRVELESISAELLGAIQGLTHFDLVFQYRPWDEGGRLVSDIRRQAVSTVAMTWRNVATAEWLRNQVDPPHKKYVSASALSELARGWRDDPKTLSLLRDILRESDRLPAALQREMHRDPEVYRTAVQELARGWPDAPETLQLLKDTIRYQGTFWPLRHAAVQELAGGWERDPEILTLLQGVARSDGHWMVRQTAVRELAKFQRQNSEIFQLFKHLLRDEDADVRKTIVQELARGWPTHPDILPMLQKLVFAEEHWIIRQAALQELVRGWRNDVETLSIVKRIASSDPDPDVRCTAIRELARGWKSSLGVLQLVKSWNDSDGSHDVRRTVLEELARGWPDDSETMCLIKKHARSGDADVRRAALHELVRGWKQDPDTLSLLKEYAKSDPDVDVRKTAVEQLVKGWSNDPDTLEIIKDRAYRDDQWEVHRVAVEALANNWKHDEEVIRFLHLAEIRYLWRPMSKESLSNSRKLSQK